MVHFYVNQSVIFIIYTTKITTMYEIYFTIISWHFDR